MQYIWDEKHFCVDWGDIMEQRSCKRKNAKIDLTLLYGNRLSSGTVLNLSEKGMLISLNMSVPSGAMLAIVIRREIVAVARVVWGGEVNSNFIAGVELLKPLKDYLELVGSLTPV